MAANRRVQTNQQWLEPSNDELERIKTEVKSLSAKGQASRLEATQLLRLIAALRHARGNCAWCGLSFSRRHRKGCLNKNSASNFKETA